MMVRIEELSYFQWSSIYSYCWKRLVAGRYATNLGHKLFGLRNWKSLLPIMLAMLSITGIFLIMKSPKLNHLPQNVGQQLH